jgi:hypothetical protein
MSGVLPPQPPLSVGDLLGIGSSLLVPLDDLGRAGATPT